MRPAAARPPLVLVVDDDEYIHRLVETTLRPLPAELVSARSGRQALVAVRHRLPDLVLLDLALPDTDGMTLLGILRERDLIPIEIPVVILSSLKDHPAVRLSGIQGFVAKPFRSMTLLRVVESALSGEPAGPRRAPPSPVAHLSPTRRISLVTAGRRAQGTAGGPATLRRKPPWERQLGGVPSGTSGSRLRGRDSRRGGNDAARRSGG